MCVGPVNQRMTSCRIYRGIRELCVGMSYLLCSAHLLVVPHLTEWFLMRLPPLPTGSIAANSGWRWLFDLMGFREQRPGTTVSLNNRLLSVSWPCQYIYSQRLLSVSVSTFMTIYLKIQHFKVGRLLWTGWQAVHKSCQYLIRTRGRSSLLATTAYFPYP